jgi:hypothetical protein
MRRVPHRALVLLSLLVTIATVGLLSREIAASRLATDSAFVLLGMAVFTVIGALIEDRRPGNPIGRINLATGVTLVLCVAFRLAAQEMDQDPGPLPAPAAVLAVLSSVTFAVALIGGSLSLVAWYPDGQLKGRTGRLLKALIVLGLAGSAIQLFRPGPIEYGWVEAVPNPLGLEALRWLFDAGAASLILIYGAGMTVGLATLVIRYRRAGPEVRAQLRWFLAAVSVPLALLVLLFTTSGQLNELVWNAWIISFLLTPIAIGIGVLRYRLYEIDRIVSRTLGYGVVTAILGALFVGLNLGLGTMVASLTGGSTLAVAAATLTVAGLFQPLRQWIQAPIDRQFNRARVDAEETLRLFGERVRDEVDLGRLLEEVRVAALQALRPAGAGLWVRGQDE